MAKLGLGCPLGFLASKPQRNKTNILDLNYDCYVEIFSYLNTLEDKLNLARAHPQFCDVLSREAPRRFRKINMRMLRFISDWDYLLHLCGESVQECELRHGRWDNDITLPFLELLNSHCRNLQHLHLIFVHSSSITTPGDDKANILEILEQKNLKCLSLTDAPAAIVLQLKNFNKLKTLYVDGFDEELTNEAFVEQLQALPVLQRLSLRFASRRPMPPLAICCPQIEHLSLENFEGSTADLGYFPKLKSLHLRWRTVVSINSELFRTLGQRYAERLEQLQLTKVLPHQVPHIVALRRLRLLSCPMWPKEALSHLRELKQIECLVLQCAEPAASLMPLLDVIKHCSKLKHLKLGKSWLQADLEHFVGVAQDVLRQQADKKKILLSLDFAATKELQKQLKGKVNSQLLHLHWGETFCGLCTPDRHTKLEAFLD